MINLFLQERPEDIETEAFNHMNYSCSMTAHAEERLRGASASSMQELRQLLALCLSLFCLHMYTYTSLRAAQERLTLLVEERKRIMDAESRANAGGRSAAAAGASSNAFGGAGSSDMLELEARRLEVMRRRQERELEQMLAYELARKGLQAIHITTLNGLLGCMGQLLECSAWAVAPPRQHTFGHPLFSAACSTAPTSHVKPALPLLAHYAAVVNPTAHKAPGPGVCSRAAPGQGKGTTEVDQGAHRGVPAPV